MVPVRLRGHHFLCILTYRGYGYTKPFVANMTDVVRQIQAGRRVVLCEGPDDICGGFTADCRTVCDHDCTKAETIDMDRLAAEAVGAVFALNAETPLVLDGRKIAELRKRFAAGTIRKACSRCSWHDFCTEIASEDFAAVKLFEPCCVPWLV